MMPSEHGGAQSALTLLENVQAVSGNLGGRCVNIMWLTKPGKFFEHWTAAEKNEAKRTFQQLAGVIDEDDSESDASDDETVCPARLSSHTLPHSLTHSRHPGYLTGATLRRMAKDGARLLGRPGMCETRS